MSRPVVVYDACLLYSSHLRSLFIYLAKSGIFQARWSADIHEEWMRTLERDFPDLTRPKLERVRSLMDAAVPDCLIEGYRPLIPSLSLPDDDDRHVLAAAIHGGAGAIVTFNLKDFPATSVAPHGIEAISPDDLTLRLLARDEAAVCAAVRTHRTSLRKPTMTPEEYLSHQALADLGGTVARLRAVIDRI